MIVEKLIFKVPYEVDPIPDDFDVIFGANYYEDWDATLGISHTSGLVNTWTSQGLNGGVFGNFGADRPSLVSSIELGKNVIEFDGVSENMNVPFSTGMYNFLHNGSGGCVIIVGYVDDADPNNSQVILDSHNITTNETGFSIRYDDRLSVPREDVILTSVAKSVNSQPPISNVSTDNAFITQQYNSFVNVIDADNATAADRSAMVVNGGSEIKNNTNTFSPVLTNASRNLTLGRRATNLDFYFKGKIARILIVDTIPTPTQLAQVQARLTYDYGTFPIT